MGARRVEINSFTSRLGRLGRTGQVTGHFPEFNFKAHLAGLGKLLGTFPSSISKLDRAFGIRFSQAFFFVMDSFLLYKHRIQSIQRSLLNQYVERLQPIPGLSNRYSTGSSSDPVGRSAVVKHSIAKPDLLGVFATSNLKKRLILCVCL